MPRVAVIGRGSIGQRHAAVFADRIGADNVRLFAAGMRDDLSVETIVDDILTMAPSHAVIASPAHRHLAFASLLLERHIHCLIEKPLAMLPAQAQQWRTSLADKPQPWVGYNLHYRPEYHFLRTHLNQLGPLHWAEFRCGQALEQWRPGRDPATSVTLRSDWGGGVLRELSHELEMAIALLGPLTVRSAQAQRGHYGGDVEEAVQASLVTGQGWPLSLSIDLYRATAERRVLLVGQEGQLAVDFIARQGQLVLHGQTKTVDFEAVDSYGVQAERFLAGQIAPENPRLDDAVMTMALIGQLEAAINRE